MRGSAKDISKRKVQLGEILLSGIQQRSFSYSVIKSYVAEVVEVIMKTISQLVENVLQLWIADIVVNPDAACQWLGEGCNCGWDWKCNSMWGNGLENGVPNKSNFEYYRWFRHKEASKWKLRYHCPSNNEDPTGLASPSCPPVFAWLWVFTVTGKLEAPIWSTIPASIAWRMKNLLNVNTLSRRLCPFPACCQTFDA